MAKIIRLFVEKLANSSLLSAFPSSIRKILSHFSFTPALCKGLIEKLAIKSETLGLFSVFGFIRREDIWLTQK